MFWKDEALRCNRDLALLAMDSSWEGFWLFFWLLWLLLLDWKLWIAGFVFAAYLGTGAKARLEESHKRQSHALGLGMAL